MRSLRRLTSYGLVAALLTFAVGCPHRSPVWSPDGEWIIVLGGAGGESVEHAASQLWLVAASGTTRRRVPPPEDGVRFLAATWIDARRFVAMTGTWDDDTVLEGSGKTWTRGVEDDAWTRVDLPAPSEERTPRRLPVVLGRDDDRWLAYASGFESVTVASLKTTKVIRTLSPAEIVGPAADGGLLITRPDDASASSVLIALDDALEPRWSVDFPTLRDTFAARLGKKPVEIVFNDTSTSHLPLGGPAPGTNAAGAGATSASTEWVGVTFTFSDVGWRDGVVGFYARLAAKDGAVLAVEHAIGLAGRPASIGAHAFALLAPQPKRDLPLAIGRFAMAATLDGAGPVERFPVTAWKKEQVYGYSLSPDGRTLAVSIHDATSSLRFFATGHSDTGHSNTGRVLAVRFIALAD